MKLLRTLLLASALAGLPSFAEAKTMALLVGVADYNEASGIRDLLGPRNDVSILWRALKSRGVAPGDITVLTDGLDTGPEFPVAQGLPHARTILENLDRLAAEANRGDTVIFYYSGHGTRQPDNPAEPEDEPETDGMDQVLLPADVGAYDPIRMTLKNAIIDDELGRKISAIRAKGAFVWAVIDACHSGTVTRGETVTRSVDPASLGIPGAPAATQASRGGTREGTMKQKVMSGEGGLAGFYAVESYDEAIERPFPGYNLPMVGEADSQRMGVFTYLMHRALTQTKVSTYRELAQEIVAQLNMDHTGGKVPPPVFDGDLDAPLPGSNAEKLPGSTSARLADGRISLDVGSLQGFDEGARIALYFPGELDKPVAEATITLANAVDSTAEEIQWLDGATPIDGGPLVAVVKDPAITFRFAVSPPPAEDGEQAVALATRVLQESFGPGAETIGITLGAPGDPQADALLRVKDGRLWVVRPDRPWVTVAGAYDETPSIALDQPQDQLAARLKTALWSLARAAKLVRVVAAADGQASADDGIVVEASISKESGGARAACSRGKPPEGTAAVPVSPLMPAAAGNCDYVTIRVSNESDVDYNVAGFYVDALGGVSVFPSRSKQTGCIRNLPAGTGRALEFTFRIDTWDEDAGKPAPSGAENFVVLAVPRIGSAPPPRLCSLTQPTLSDMQQTRNVENAATRGGSSKLAALMGGVAGESTRAASASDDDGGPAMTGRLFVFDVKP